MSSLNDLEGEPFRASNPEANIAVRTATQKSPDEAALNLQLSRRFGVPVSVVEHDRERMRSTAKAQDAQDMLAEMPVTAAWIASNPRNAAVSHDDLGVLGSIEKWGGNAKNWLRNSFLSLANGIDTFIMNDERLPERLPIIAQRTPAALGAGALNQLAGVAQYIAGGEDVAEQYDITAGAQRYLFGGTIEEATGNLFRNLGNSAQARAASLYPKPTGSYLTDTIVGGISNIPGSIMSLAGGIGLRAAGATIGEAALGGALLGGVSQGGSSYANARRQGLSPGKAFLYANVDLATETAGEFVGEFKFLKASEAGNTILSRFIQQQLGEQVGEQFTTIAQDFSAWAVLPENADKTVGDFFRQLPEDMMTTAIQTLVAGAVTNVTISGLERAANLPALQARRDRAEAQLAQQTRDQLEQIIRMAEQSKLRERDGQTFQDFMAAQVEDGPLENVYIDANTLNQALATGGEDAAALLRAAPSIQLQMEQALATNGDIRIPTAELATALPGNALEQTILDNVRIDPFAKSAADAKREDAGEINRLAQQFAEQIDEQVADAEFTAAQSRVSEAFRAKLDAANRFNADTNAQYADLIGTFYAVMASRAGLTPEEMAARYPLDIRATEMPTTPSESRLSQSAVLNIGLDRPDGGRNSREDVMKALQSVKADVVDAREVQSDTEPTLSIVLREELTAAEAERISEALGQDAIAQRRRDGSGGLYGPRAAQWGSFDPNFFFMPNGQRASEIPGAARQTVRAEPSQQTVDPATQKEIQSAAWTPERIDRLIEAYSDPEDPSKTEAFAVLMSPTEFMQLTLSEKGQSILRSMDPERTRARPLDEKRLQASEQPILLGIRYPKEPSKVQRAMGLTELPTAIMAHEGRHRMAALEAAGITQVPVVVEITEPSTPKAYEPLAAVAVTPQRSRLDDLNNGTSGTTLRNLIPITEANRDQLVRMAEGARVLFQGPRGYLTFGSDITASPSAITLLNASDLSTFLHESGHFFLEVMTHMSSQPGAPAGVVKDMNAILKWFGVPSLYLWQRMTLDQKRGFHEQFARGFEAYLFEGKAPSVAMRGPFQRFRAWLVAVYRNNIENLNVKLTAEMRGVFSRMLATNDAIETAQREAAMLAQFTSKPDSMTQQEWEDYQELGRAATATAIENLQSRSLRDMRFTAKAHARELKRLQAEVKQLRADTEADVRAEHESKPVNQARAFLRKGMLNGQVVEGPHKFDTASFDALYEGFDKTALKAVKRKLRGMFSKEDGINPEQIAELFGFGSADALVTELLKDTNVEEHIQADTDLRMLENYGQIGSPAALSVAASEAIHNDVRARFVATELAATDKSYGKPRLLAAAAKRYADDIVRRLKVREVRPAQYEAAERKAARLAFDAIKSGNTAAAARERRAQLLNFYATKAAREAQSDVRKTITYFKNLNLNATRAKIDPSYMDQIDKLLERFDFRVSAQDSAQRGRAQERRRAAIADWIEEQRDKGFEPIFSEDPFITDENVRVHYRDLTVDELRGVADAVRNIEHLGRLKTRLLKNKEQRDLAAAQQEGAASILANAYKIVQQPIGARTWLEHAKAKIDDFLAMHRKLNSMMREMDGSTDRGVMWKFFSRPLNSSSDDEAVRTASAVRRLHEIFSPLRSENTHTKVFEPAIQQSVSLETRLGVALNMGNSVNMERILNGEQWTEDQLRAVVAPLEEHHWRFVQNLWDFIGSYWEDIKAKQLRVTGVAPERTEAQPLSVTLPDGTRLDLSGGYYPIKYDAGRDERVQADTEADILRQITRGLFSAAQTRRGHVKERAASTGLPLRYDFNVALEHVNQVIHDLSWHETLIDLNRLTRSGPIAEAIRTSYGPSTLKWIREGLKDIAIGSVGSQNALESSVNYLRTGSTVAGLGWNLVTSLFQPLGLANSIKRIGPKYVGKGVLNMLGSPSRMSNATKWIHEQSDFMRLRGQTMQREIAEIRQQFSAPGPVREQLNRLPGAPAALDAVNASFFVFIEKAQMLADLPTWSGAYEKAIDQGETHERAVAFADQAVRDSQGGGQLSDLSGIQRGGPFLKLWTNFYSWFNVTYNQLAESVNETRRVGPSRLPLLAADVLLLAVVPQFLVSVIRGTIAGDDWDDLEKRAVQDQLGGYLGFIIGLREFGAVFGVGNGYSGPAGARIVSAAVDLGKQAQQGELDEDFWKSVNSTGGVLFHYPSVQVQRTVLGMQALWDGKTRNPAVLLFGPPPAGK